MHPLSVKGMRQLISWHSRACMQKHNAVTIILQGKTGTIVFKISNGNLGRLRLGSTESGIPSGEEVQYPINVGGVADMSEFEFKVEVFFNTLDF